MAKTIYTADDQYMTAKNDTLVITDPCYIMPDRHWEHFLNLEFTENPIGLDNYLKKYHNFKDVIAGDTGIGDWNNTIYNINTNEDLGKFAADAGMVVCCKLTDLADYNPDYKRILDQLKQNNCVAIIENYSGSICLSYENYEGDTDRLAVLSGVGETGNDIDWSSEHLSSQE